MSQLPKRFPKELADATADSMTSMGIHYWFNQANVRNGRAMIIGPEDTPYAFCPLVFNFDFPADYPFSSPTVTFLTSDGTTRFHPNLYVAGKVCLSILGTWKGPAWSAAMTISTVLSSIQSLLEANPIVNEPGWESYKLDNPKAKDYAEFVRFRLVALSYRALKQWKAGQIPHDWACFADVLEEKGDQLLEKLEGIIRSAKGDVTYAALPYNMGGKAEWSRLLAPVKLPESAPL